MRKCLLMLILYGYFIPWAVVNAQSSKEITYPIVGHSIPDFDLRNIEYYSKMKANVKEFRGKWLMLDLWNRRCGGCIASFPHLNATRKKFAARMEVLTVGLYSYGSNSSLISERKLSEEIYRKSVEKNRLQLPCAFDSLLGMQWDIQQVPYIIIIDPKGVVRALTTWFADEQIDSLLNGFSPSLRHAMRGHEDRGLQARPPIGKTIFTAISDTNSYSGPRFAFANDNDFPIIVNTDNIYGWDTIAARQVGIFHNGDYRPCLQVFNITYEMTYQRFRGQVNAMHYTPKLLKRNMPSGDWIVHYKWQNDWKATAAKISY